MTVDNENHDKSAKVTQQPSRSPLEDLVDNQGPLLAHSFG